MPTRPQAWRFRTIYEGFEHGGLRTALDETRSTPLNRVGRVVRITGLVLDADGHRVGHFTRLLASGRQGLRARHEELELDEAARGHGFARALHVHAEATYRAMGVWCITLHAEHVGSLLWPRLGFDFDLSRTAGGSEAERRTEAVRALLSPRARQVVGRPRPAELLADWAASGDPARAAAVAALRLRLPEGARPAAEEPLLHPGAIAAFDAEGTRLGAELMLGASWDGVRILAPGP